ncbi:hypothetical protein MA47_07430 [Corynebacterium auriscanis]|uniref:Uncharacterized protein n=1 Tax=Corynebacterium auriscanis TaxID=99807 RepID=A0A0A2DGY4_9CORY|nr:hypothetical protein MA47_07430 [Corynebacterium auriscanis]
MMPAELNKKMLSENADSMTRRQARALEELGIDSHGMAKEDRLLLNARHEIGINGSAGKNVRNGALKWARYMVDSEAIRVYGM